ncbi:uncharacterized protein LOC6560050 [Drosophila grimshawi]|uniref:GH21041 n=1 Tax=Drosophila grimshawi TaxID=7222 RepID=B4J5G1_DROGR|nr:uncharacterized protein LOC6560050 [Drosophila grimshawi]EDW00724.1 GH21041 [Drosophila grimshawi]
MFFSLAQTLVCVLLINGGLYALHLSGNSEKSPISNSGSAASLASNSGSPMVSGASGGWQPQQQQQLLHQHTGGGAPPGGGSGHGHRSMSDSHRSAAAAAFDATTGRLNKEIADMAQLERERLMLLGLAKQTAESPDAPPGHHGRPIIAGRVQMQPSEDLDVGDYPALLQQAARGFMFGSVHKQPPPPPLAANAQDYEELREFGRRPVKYDYGREVQPPEPHELDSETLYEPLHGFGDFDDFSELESNPEDTHVGEDELLRELDAYQYHGLEEDAAMQLPENPYRTLEQLELGAPETLQQLFEHQEQPAKSNPKVHVPMGNYNIRMQQKWARKRSQTPKQQQQQQPTLQRNIFGQHFKQQRGKLALANSEATASKHLKASARSGSSSSAKIEKSIQDENGDNVANHQQQQQAKESSAAAAAAAAAGTVVGKAEQQQLSQKSSQQEQNKKDSDQQLTHPNHKRSGNAGGSLGGYAAPPVTHSIASQLMLRSQRGQRQYDVPQIECPTAMDGMERFACPTPDLQGRYRCIDDHVLCDGFIDCPEGEDEHRSSCMFYKTTKAHLDVLADALLRWARGR